VAISLLSGKEEVRDTEAIVSDYSFLKHLFKHEFVFDEKEDLGEKITAVMGYFLDAAFITESEDGGGYKITKLGHDKLPIWAALAKTFIESYWIAVKTMSGQKEKARKRGDLLKEMNYLGRRFHKLGVVEHIGAISELTYKNAVNFINEDILKATDRSEGESDVNERLSQLGQRLYELSHYRS
jgi:glycerol-3-phosphate O-acyltransferase